MDRELLESTFIIGGIVVRLSANSANDTFEMEPAYDRFLLDGSAASRSKPDIDLKIHRGPLPETGEAEQVFDSGGLWKLLRRGDKYYIPLSSPARDPQTYRMLVINSDLTRRYDGRQRQRTSYPPEISP
jgi:hypothetical protein